jgi:predicted TIM-barrel fold metal-dependent hydrolase
MNNDVPVFDFHARLTARPGDRDRLLDAMDATGIRRAVISAGGIIDLDRLSRRIVNGEWGDDEETRADAHNCRILDACRDSNARLVPFYFANPHAHPAIYRHWAPQFRGLELSPAVHGVTFDDPRTIALVEIAAARGHPVYVVCLGRPGTRAADLVALARRFPAIPFIFGHAGCIGLDAHGVGTVAIQDNIHVETSGCFTIVARLAIEQLGAHRVLFGTEHPLQHPGVELAKFDALHLTAATWRQVAWTNAHRLLQEEPA